MKNTTLLFFTFLILVLFACGKKKNRKEDKISQKITDDTVFIRNLRWQDTVDGIRYTSWNKVFIDSEPKSRNYDRVLDFDNLDAYLADYNTANLKDFDTSGLPDDWLPLYNYRGKYFIYEPGDTDTKFSLRDSLFISYFHEPSYFAIDNFLLNSNNQYHLQTQSLQAPSEHHIPQFDIFIIDSTYKIAVWKETGNMSGKPRYSLMIPRENARKFPIIVNEASEKPNEFKFDPIDFQKLMRRAEIIDFTP